MISVIVPFWNSEKWICRCIKSLKLQRGDFEFILINDSSDDKGEEIARELISDDGRFRLLENKNRRGPSGARNTGIESARGEWITFLDADDEMLPGAYDTFRMVIESAEANIHQLNHLRYYTATDRIALKYWNAGGWYGLSNPAQLWCGVWNKIFRADFIKDIRFDESMFYGEDGMFVLECLKKDPRIHHGEKRQTTVKHRFDNKESLSHVKTGKDLMKQVHTYEKFLQKQTDPELRKFVIKEIAKLWSSKTFERSLGTK